jgi:hypothetical protein
MHRIVTQYLKSLAFMTLGVIASACVIVNDDDKDSTSTTGGSRATVGGSANRGGSAGRATGGSQPGGGAGGAPEAGAPASGAAGAPAGGAAQAGTSGSGVAGTPQAGASSAGEAGASQAGASQAGRPAAGAAGAPTAGMSAGGEGGASQAGASAGGAGGVATSSIAQIEGASFFQGTAPTPVGGLAAPTVTAPVKVINGGTAQYLVTLSGTNLEALLVSITGDNGYYVVPLGADSGQQAVAITLLSGFTGSTLTVGFALRNAAGSVTEWSSNTIEVVTTGTGDVKVSLTFDQDEDLDLYVTDPLGNKIDYTNKTVLYNDTGLGAHLDLDSNPMCLIDEVNNENIFWDPGSAPRGDYLVEVNYYQNCSAPSVNYTVTVSIGTVVSRYTGSFVAADEKVTRAVTTFAY